MEDIVLKRDYKETLDIIISKTIEYLEKSKINTMVLGISGGIDSTVVAVIGNLICREHPKFRLIGISMPSKTNTFGENYIAKEVIENFCDYELSEIQEINPEFEEITQHLDVYNRSGLTDGNIKARIRMIHLYDKASKYGGIVLDTDNLTEHFLGFWTLHGDVGDYSPIGMLWKDEVYELAKYIRDNAKLNVDQKRILDASILALPTDGNGVKDGGDLAQIAPEINDYHHVSKILRYIVLNKKLGKFDTGEYFSVFKQYPSRDLNKILTRYYNSEFKRKRMPIRIENDINKELYF